MCQESVGNDFLSLIHGTDPCHFALVVDRIFSYTNARLRRRVHKEAT